MVTSLFRMRNAVWILTWSFCGLFLGICARSAGDAIVVNPGRHICMKEEKTHSAVKKLETYCRPQYTKHLHMCQRGGQYQLCTSFRLVYTIAYREKIHNQVSTRMLYSCCPGWKQRRQGENGCLDPICVNDCQNGGRCVAPNLCKCAKGWEGKHCDNDIDECRENETLCQHKCVNTAGSHHCTCEEGFRLGEDKRSCTFCLKCLPDYSDMLSGYQDLTNRVSILEKEKKELAQNVTILAEENKKHLETIRNDVMNVRDVMADMAVNSAKLDVEENTDESEDESASTQEKEAKLASKDKERRTKENNDHVIVPTPTAPPAEARRVYNGPSWYRIRSLSEQIAMLEERLEDCTCKYDKPRWPNT